MCHVAKVILVVLASYVEWAPITNIMFDEGIVLQICVLLLQDKQLQNAAAEVLLQLASRKVLYNIFTCKF